LVGNRELPLRFVLHYTSVLRTH